MVTKYKLGSFESLTALCASVQRREEEGMAQFYSFFERGLAYFFARASDTRFVEDNVHETIMAAFNLIQKGELREPERVGGLIRQIARCQAANSLDRKQTELTRNVEADPDAVKSGCDVEKDFELAERRRILRDSLAQLKDRDREVLVRFYLQEEAWPDICNAMKLTPVQFRLLKSRAKQKLGLIGQRKIRKPLPPAA